MPETTRAAQMARIFGRVNRLHATRRIDAGVKLGRFERLAQEPATSSACR